MAKHDESFSVCGDGVDVSMKAEKQQEKSVAMDKREDGKCDKPGKPWKCLWPPGRVSESETETEPEESEEEAREKELRHLAESESSEDEYMTGQGPIIVIGPDGKRREFRKYPRLLSDAEIALGQVHLYEHDRNNIPPDLAPYLMRYLNDRLAQQLKAKPLSLVVSDFDSSSDSSSSSEEEEAAIAPEPATPTHDGKTAPPPRDGKRSHSRGGNSSSRDGKRSRRHRKRDRSRNDPTDQHQRRSRRL